jgi:hypothetical protein
MIQRGVIRYHWQPAGTNRSFFAVACVGFGMMGLWVGAYQKSLPFLIFGGFCLLSAVLFCIRREIRIDTESRAVILEDRLWGRLRIRLTRWPLSDFIAVTCTSNRGNTIDGVLLAVGLRRRSGRILRIQYLNNCTEPLNEARWLAGKIGLPLEESAF